MGVYRLLLVALEAETLRWRTRTARLAVRAVFACVALLFLTGAMVFGHLAAWIWLRTGQQFDAYATCGILAGADLLVALLMLLLASRSGPGRTERDAIEVRHQAMQGIAAYLSVGRLLIELLELVKTMLRKPEA